MSSNPNDSFVASAQGDLRLPETGTNNLWYQDRNTDAALIFVHGIFSDSRSCWLREGSPPVYWPDLVSRDRRFNGYSLYLGGYYTALDAGAFKIQHCADELFRALGRPDRPGAKSAFDRDTLVFVCHSTGGIVVRYLLETRAAEFKTKTVGLVLIASPSFGSAWATKLSWLSEFHNAQLARQLEWGNNSLDDLDERFHRLVKEKRIPRLVGVEAYENHFVFHRKFLPDRLIVVDKNSAGRYFAPAHLLAKTDHFTSVKPDSEHHPAHELLVDFCAELELCQHQYTSAVAPERAGIQSQSGGSVVSNVGSASEQVSIPFAEVHFAAAKPGEVHQDTILVTPADPPNIKPEYVEPRVGFVGSQSANEPPKNLASTGQPPTPPQQNPTLEAADARRAGTAYDTAAVRELLTNALSDEELSELCLDHFPRVYDQFSTGMTKSQKLQRLIEYCSRQHAFPKLLQLVRKVNPNGFADYDR